MNGFVTLNVLQRSLYLFELSLVVMLAWGLSGWFFSNHPMAMNNFTSHTGALEKSIDLQALETISLFGFEKKESSQINSSKLALASQLNIKLVGTVVADAGNSIAIVMVSGQSKQQVFHVGDSMQSGVVLKKVEAYAIVVDHQGKLERIDLKKGKAIAGMSQRQAVNKTRYRPANARNRILKRGVLAKGLDNFPVLLTQALATPHMNQGKIDGFTISKIVPGSLYETIGLQNGDIVRKVNGQAITSAAQAMQMYQDLKNAKSIDLELGRDGTNVPIHYDIQ